MKGLGGCFILSGIRQAEHNYNGTATNIENRLLYIACAAFTVSKALATSHIASIRFVEACKVFTHVTAIILIMLYLLFVFFKFYSHESIWEELERDESAETHERQLPGFRPAYAFTLVVILTLIIICTRYLIGSVDGMLTSIRMNKSFIGFVLLPIITNTSNYFKTYAIAYDGHMDLAVRLTLSTCVDIALCTYPILLILSWGVGESMTMEFGLLETLVLILTVFFLSQLVYKGRSNYFQGFVSLGL
jgi:Ca2+:H+ antiporter